MHEIFSVVMNAVIKRAGCSYMYILGGTFFPLLIYIRIKYIFRLWSVYAFEEKLKTYNDNNILLLRLFMTSNEMHRRRKV